MVRTDTPTLLYREEENGNETYVVAVFEDVIQHTPCDNYRKRRIVHVLNQRNVLSSWVEEYDPFFGRWGKFYHNLDCAWDTDGFNII